QDQKSLGSIESVHLRKELVQRLFSLVVPSVMGITALADSVDLVDKNNTWGVFLGLFKKVPDTGRAHAHEHLHKFRSGQRKERNVRLSGHRFGKKRFTGSRWSHKKRALGKLGSDGCIFPRIMKEIHNLLERLLGL